MLQPNVQSLLVQQESCRRGRKDDDEYCIRPCPRCERCRQYRAGDPVTA